MFRMIATMAAMLMAGPALADMVTREAQGSVGDVTDRLETAVEDAGATVFARVDHGEGAQSVDMDLPDAQLLIFGNPQLGTQVMQEDIQAGVFLPMRVLVYDDNGTTRIAYEEVEDMFDDLDVDDDSDVTRQIEQALQDLTTTAAQPQG